MSITVLVVRPDAPAELIRLSTGDLLPQLQQLVGGYIEAIGPYVEVPEPWHGYVNEDGITMKLPINEAASDLACRLGWHGQYSLFGTAAFLGTDGDEETDVPAWVIDTAEQFIDYDQTKWKAPA